MPMRNSFLILLISVGCGEVKNVPIDAGVDAIDAPMQDAPDPYKLVAEVRATPNRNLDLLFVIDDSPSMLDKQANLAANFPSFINVLNSAPGGLPDLHLGVVTTDLGTQGSEVVSPGAPIGQVGNGGCSGTGDGGNLQTFGAPITGTFISDIKQAGGVRTRNYTGTLEAAFSTMARGAGAGGCGFEQPLAAMRRALNNNPQNAGFLRPDAMLGVVFVTDEDDCSIRNPTVLGPETAALGPLQSFRCTRFGVTCAVGGTTTDEMNTVGVKSGCASNETSPYLTDVLPYRTFLHSLKQDVRNVVVASIMGTPEPFAIELRTQPGGGPAVNAVSHSCTYQGALGIEVADPGTRLKTLLDQFVDRNVSSTICQQNLATGFAQIGQILTRGGGTPCIGVSLGAVPDCKVADVVGMTTTPIAACGASPVAPCWTLQRDVINCVLADQLSLVVTRSAPAAPATVTTMRCLLP